ncbi:MAG: hypothetical protein ACLUFM_02900 [Lachnospiraceae bacterium]
MALPIRRACVNNNDKDVLRIHRFPWDRHGQYLMYVRTVIEESELSGGGTFSAVIYYVEASAGDTTDVPVPENSEYEISGNNIDGFIVTVKG